MLNYVIYDGVDSRDFGLYVVDSGNSPQILNIAPSKITRNSRIAGRDSSYTWEQNYDTRRISVNLYSNNKQDDITQLISRWLGKKGNKTLILSTEPKKLYYATIETQLSMSTYNELYQGFITVDFICYDPIGYSHLSTIDLLNAEYDMGGVYYNDSIYYVDLFGSEYSFVGGDLPNLDIFNDSNCDLATPVITIVGSGDSITIEHFRDVGRTDLVASCTYGAFSGTLVIDSLLMDTFLNSTLTVLESGDYFKLLGGNEIIPINQGELELINGYEITLDSLASNTNDFYNGSVISISTEDKVEYFNILDYDGATKIATISTSPSFKLATCKRYSIFDMSENINYFKITGAGLSITSVIFDFKFTYL